METPERQSSSPLSLEESQGAIRNTQQESQQTQSQDLEARGLNLSRPGELTKAPSFETCTYNWNGSVYLADLSPHFPNLKPEDAQEAPPTDKGKPSKAKWDEPLHTAYCRACEWQIREGKRAEQQMKDEAWTPIIKLIQPYHTRGWKITVKQCRDKWTTWKAYFNIYIKLRDTSGMGWDDPAQKFSTTEDVWARLIAAHPGWKPWRTNPVKCVKEMCFAFEGRVAVGDKADGIDAELQALGVVVVRDNRNITTRQQPDRLQELADEYREEDETSSMPDLDNILRRLPPKTYPLKRDASQAELNAAQSSLQHRRVRKKGASQLETFADAIEDGNNESRLGREAIERQHELEFQRSKPETIQAQAKLFKDYPGLDGLLGKAQWKALLAYMKEDDDDALISRAQLYLNTTKGRIRDELMAEFVGCIGCDIVALKGGDGQWEFTHERS
jgi:Myb/SANT-like DNA-binding domain